MCKLTHPGHTHIYFYFVHLQLRAVDAQLMKGLDSARAELRVIDCVVDLVDCLFTLLSLSPSTVNAIIKAYVVPK